MLYHRQLRESGETVLLAGGQYTVDAVLGLGGSCVVYAAHYVDQLNPSHSHHVLLKELYPFQPRGEIYRGEGGDIRCTPAARPAFESAKAAFARGNQINLELLEKLPEETSGNLISCEAYGTYYSVLSVHGGESLEARLARGEPACLRSACELLGQIAQALDGFHRNGMLHLDISPDNILLLSGRAMLIDYNSCWAQRSSLDDELRFSVKPGYSPPEVLLRDVGSIGTASDLYAVCALFFHMLMGRAMGETEQQGKLRRRDLENAAVFQEEPATAVSKALSILRRGLHPLARKRYQTTGELTADINELLRRIDGFGVTSSALWEMSAAQAGRRVREEYLEQHISLDGIETDRKSLYQELCQGGCVLLKGPGGMGKSTLLALLQREHLKPYREGQAVPVYVPLVDYQQAGEQAGFLRGWLLRQLKLERGAGVQDALFALDRLLEKRGRQSVSLILLLDGLNEAGRRREPLLREIEGLAASGGVGLLVTDRSDAVKEYALPSFQTAQLLPLSEDTVRTQLERQGLAPPEQEQTIHLLQNPMLLTLYCKAGGLGGTDSGTGATRDGIVGAYVDSLCQRELRLDSGDTAMELRHRYLLGHLLPEAALLQRRKGRPLSTGELYRAVDRGRKRLCSRAYGLAFPAFLGKSRLMFQGFQNGSEWFDFAVTEQLVQELNLLACHEGERYSLVHDNFLPYLVQRAKINRRSYTRRAWKGWAVKGGICLLVTLAVGWGGARAYLSAAAREPVYTARQAALVKDRLEYLAMNLQALDGQWTAAESVLDRVGDGTSDEDLEREVQRQRQALELCGKRLRRDGAFAAGVAGFAGEDVADQLQALYDHPGELEPLLERMLNYIQGRFCPEGEEGLHVSDREKRGELAAAFRAWLERDQSVCFLRYSLLLQGLPAESREVLEENMLYLSTFADYIAGVPAGADLEESLEKALWLLEESQENMDAKLSAYEQAVREGGK